MKCPSIFSPRYCAFLSSAPSPLTATCIAVLLALSSPLTGLAQDAGLGGQSEPVSGAQPSVIQRVEIVAKQGSTELRRAASVAKQIYGREELDRYGDTNTLDVLRRLPGVNVDSGGPRMRGLGAGYTQILINGDPAPQGFNLDQLSPSQIERIEVIKAATADQSTQAIAGTINVILKETSRRSLSSLRLGVSNGRDRPTGNLNYSITESNGPFNLSLPVSVFEWDRQVRNLIDRKMTGTDGQPAVSEQLGTNTSWVGATTWHPGSITKSVTNKLWHWPLFSKKVIGNSAQILPTALFQDLPYLMTTPFKAAFGKIDAAI